jgi:hypothetical protein
MQFYILVSYKITAHAKYKKYMQNMIVKIQYLNLQSFFEPLTYFDGCVLFTISGDVGYVSRDVTSLHGGPEALLSSKGPTLMGRFTDNFTTFITKSSN